MSPLRSSFQKFFLTVFLVLFVVGVPAIGRTNHIPSAPQDEGDYENQIIQRASDEHLAQRRYWHILLHYKKTLWGGYESEEDGSDFFAASDGKTDPQAELIATLHGFFQSPTNLKTGEEHPQCLFPARYKWLSAQLAFDPKKLPRQPCDRLETWLKELDPGKITLVFASHYMNNPASMFGHTFLRIDKKQDKGKLLNYGVNYAATLTEGDKINPFLYTAKGLLGGFSGSFTLFPYYVKVQEYNNLENRDLWEYELNFTQDEVNNVMLHLWELGGNFFDYYYFQENCSYHILSLLETADARLHLTDPFTFHVIPAETVKVVTQHPHLVSRRVYRPSLLSQMKAKVLRMSDTQKRLLDRLSDDPEEIKSEAYDRLSVSEKGLLMDAYLDYAQYREMAQKKAASMINPATHEILVERSRLDYRDDAAPIYFSTPPDLGHGSARISLGAGQNETEPFEQIAIRPAYHDLLADDIGYNKHSQILFLDLTARYYNDSKIARLDRFDLINILSLTPYDPLLKKFSWGLRISREAVLDLPCRYCNASKMGYDIGMAYQPFAPVLLYGLAGLEMEIAPEFDHNYRVGSGGTVGTRIDLAEGWRIQITGQFMDFPLGFKSRFSMFSVDQRYTIDHDLDFRVGWRAMRRGPDRHEWSTTINYYF